MINCPNCRKMHSEQAKIAHCLNCAHPFNLAKWRQESWRQKSIVTQSTKAFESRELKQLYRSACRICGTKFTTESAIVRKCSDCSKNYSIL